MSADKAVPKTRARWIVIAIALFTLAYGAIILTKVQQEVQSFVNEAEHSQANAAGYLAERVSGRLAEARNMLSFATADLQNLSRAEIASSIDQRLATLQESGRISAAALLLPGGSIHATETMPDDVRRIADRALAASTGLSTEIGPDRSAAIAIALPVQLRDETVGAMLAYLPAADILPDWGDNRIVALSDAESGMLTIRPNMTGATPGMFLPERFGLSRPQIDQLAQGAGGATSDAYLGEERVTFAVAPITGSGLRVYALGQTRIDQSALIRMASFYGVLFLAPIFVALGLSGLVFMQMKRLRSTRQQLVENEQRFRFAIEGARCGVWDWDPDTDVVVVTDSLARILGLPRSVRCNGQDFLRLFSQPDRDRVRAAMRSAPNGGDIDLEVLAAGAPVWLQMRGRPLPDAQGQFSGRIVGVAIDVTERKGAQARVAAAENRLRAALESMTESFVLWDSKQRLVLWNRKFRDLFDFSEGLLKPGMAYSAVEQAAARAIKAVHDEAGDAETYELELADGRWLHYSERATADGGLVSVGADITDLKRQETALKDSESQLRRTVEDVRRNEMRIKELANEYESEKIRAEEANRSKSEFLANMSHELRTPLNAINGFSEIMLREMFGPLGDERYVGYMKDILSSGQHLLELINDILDMSKIEAGKMQLQPEPTDAAELVEQALRIVRGRAEEKMLQLRADASDLPELEIDPRAFKQVIINLISNAVKFTPEGGRVTVRAFLSGSGVVFQVADTGIGISKDDLPRLGRPFEQIESQHSKSHQGSGLGLALSRSLIELHGGSLSIDSTLGEGTTVSFVIPISQDQPIDLPSELEQTGTAPAASLEPEIAAADEVVGNTATDGAVYSDPHDDEFLDGDDEFVDLVETTMALASDK